MEEEVEEVVEMEKEKVREGGGQEAWEMEGWEKAEKAEKAEEERGMEREDWEKADWEEVVEGEGGGKVGRVQQPSSRCRCSLRGISSLTDRKPDQTASQ